MQSVAVFSNPPNWAGYIAAGAGPCGHAPVTSGNIKPANLDCSNPSGGPCSGTVAGRHTTVVFQPKLTYTQPGGWNNYLARAHDLEFSPPGANWTKDRQDEVAVFPGIATARGQCASGPSAIRTPAAFVHWIQRHPGLDATRPQPVDVGGLRGYVLDIQMQKTWKRGCSWSHGRPAIVLVEGIPPKLGVEYEVEPRPFAMRLYLLAWQGGTLGIDLISQHGRSELDRYNQFVKTFRFAGRR